MTSIEGDRRRQSPPSPAVQMIMTAARLCLLAKCEETHNHQQSGGTNQQKLSGPNPSHGVPLSPCTEGLGIVSIANYFTFPLTVQASCFLEPAPVPHPSGCIFQL